MVIYGVVDETGKLVTDLYNDLSSWKRKWVAEHYAAYCSYVSGHKCVVVPIPWAGNW